MAVRDISQAQFVAAVVKHGMSFEGFMGYVRIPHSSGKGATNVSHHNAGTNRRAKLAYLLAAKDRFEMETSDATIAHKDEIVIHK